MPHFLRLFLALQLGISEEKVRAIAPEVGGGFGSKLQIYGEEIVLAWASRKLERPIKWIEGRSEGMMATHHGRDQVATCGSAPPATARSPPSTRRSSPTSAPT